MKALLPASGLTRCLRSGPRSCGRKKAPRGRDGAGRGLLRVTAAGGSCRSRGTAKPGSEDLGRARRALTVASATGEVLADRRAATETGVSGARDDLPGEIATGNAFGGAVVSSAARLERVHAACGPDAGREGRVREMGGRSPACRGEFEKRKYFMGDDE